VLLRYDVTPDRARPHAALVRLRLTPRFAGAVTVTDALEGRAAEYTVPAGRGHRGRAQWVDLSSRRLHVRATVASVLRGGRTRALRRRNRQTVAQRIRLRVRRGRTYTLTKSVGVAVSTDGGGATPHARALAAARAEARLGYAAARAASDRAWAPLWESDIEVHGDRRLQREVRASYFALLASVRDDDPWAPSPGGLSSDGYNGHVFWDSETWMYPSLLATAPGLARQMLRYRFDRLDAARRNARRTGYAGARFPWESALSGSEETPSCCNTGKWEVHVSSDIALAAWQYWLATGDRAWLESTGWPVVAGIADFWVSRSHANADGSRSIDGVIPPDEYHERIDDSVYTNVAARDSLRIAGRMAALLGRPADPDWTAVANTLRVPFDAATAVHPEFAGYKGDTVKQADVTLLPYPWENAQPAAVSRADLDYYVPRTDPAGPSMTDAIHSIVTSELGTPGCAAFTFTRRSVDPFMRGPYFQFSEARTGGAFTFTTGAGGFLQEFLYGYSGWRWRADRIRLDPSLPPQLSGVTLRAVHWRGRTLRVEIGRAATTVTLLAGPALTLESPAGTTSLATGARATLPTRLPAASPTADAARCRPASARPRTAEPPEAAVDGTDATSWLAERAHTRLTVDLGRRLALRALTITRPRVLAVANGKSGTDDHARTGPTRSAGELVSVSANGRGWRRLDRLAKPGLRDTIAVGGAPVRYIRVAALRDASEAHPLVVGELTTQASGP
jgi:trehalose/maltose hydrolase-like predicted phosphorylase